MNILAPAPNRSTPQRGQGIILEYRIEGGRALIDGDLIDTTIDIANGRIEAVGRGGAAPRRVDASGLLVMPGIVDIHGDAFERQMMPRPGVDFPIDIALIDSDRQAIANGITTIFHGVTWSWEPGLRGTENARAILGAIEQLRGTLRADTRFHLRHETYNLDAEDEIIAWMQAGRVDALAFNDHMTVIIKDMKRPDKVAQMARRAGLSNDAFDALAARVARRAADVPTSIERLAKAAQSCNVPLLSHDDTSPAEREQYRVLGCRIAEFPTNEETARSAVAAGDATVFGAPNVVRGKSHTGWTNATEMVRRGLCTILASDYYYPAPLIAALRLAQLSAAPLPQAWRLIAEAPAAAMGLADRGIIAPGKRADLVLIDADEVRRPEVVATIAAGAIVFLSDAERLKA
jgi:alpha-D-ribose 1-methylphosphonate 5-triphosphate diphosphatase